MDKSSIDRIRSATFSVVRRGYDKREVDRFLIQVADWLETGAGDPTRAEIIRGELERVGDKTARILASAEESAEQLRSEAEAEAAEVLERARAEANRLRAEAEEHSRSEREAADEEARRARLEASRHADEIVSEAESRAESMNEQALRRRRDLEALIGDLLERREDVLEDVDRLADELAGLVSAHSSRDRERYAEAEAGEGDEQGELEEGEQAYPQEAEFEAEFDEEEQASTPTTPLRIERE